MQIVKFAPCGFQCDSWCRCWKSRFFKDSQNYSLHPLSSIITHNCYQHCFVKLVPVLSFLISVQNSSKLFLCNLFAAAWTDIELDLPPACHHLSKCLLRSFRSDQQRRAVPTLSISVSLKEWTVYSFRMCILFFFFLQGQAERGTEDGGRKGLDGKWHIVVPEIGVSTTIPSLGNFFSFQLINKTKKVETF